MSSPAQLRRVRMKWNGTLSGPSKTTAIHKLASGHARASSTPASRPKSRRSILQDTTMPSAASNVKSSTSPKAGRAYEKSNLGVGLSPRPAGRGPQHATGPPQADASKSETTGRREGGKPRGSFWGSSRAPSRGFVDVVFDHLSSAQPNEPSRLPAFLFARPRDLRRLKTLNQFEEGAVFAAGGALGFAEHLAAADVELAVDGCRVLLQ